MTLFENPHRANIESACLTQLRRILLLIALLLVTQPLALLQADYRAVPPCSGGEIGTIETFSPYNLKRRSKCSIPLEIEELSIALPKNDLKSGKARQASYSLSFKDADGKKINALEASAIQYLAESLKLKVDTTRSDGNTGIVFLSKINQQIKSYALLSDGQFVELVKLPDSDIRVKAGNLGSINPLLVDFLTRTRRLPVLVSLSDDHSTLIVDSRLSAVGGKISTATLVLEVPGKPDRYIGFMPRTGSESSQKDNQKNCSNGSSDSPTITLEYIKKLSLGESVEPAALAAAAAGEPRCTCTTIRGETTCKFKDKDGKLGTVTSCDCPKGQTVNKCKDNCGVCVEGRCDGACDANTQECCVSKAGRTCKDRASEKCCPYGVCPLKDSNQKPMDCGACPKQPCVPFCAGTRCGGCGTAGHLTCCGPLTFCCGNDRTGITCCDISDTCNNGRCIAPTTTTITNPTTTTRQVTSTTIGTTTTTTRPVTSSSTTSTTSTTRQVTSSSTSTTSTTRPIFPSSTTSTTTTTRPVWPPSTTSTSTSTTRPIFPSTTITTTTTTRPVGTPSTTSTTTSTRPFTPSTTTTSTSTTRPSITSTTRPRY